MMGRAGCDSANVLLNYKRNYNSIKDRKGDFKIPIYSSLQRSSLRLSKNPAFLKADHVLFCFLFFIFLGLIMS